MKYILSLLLVVTTAAIFSCKEEKAIKEEQQEDVVTIEYPEVYELSNIILALTEYGKTDKWQVRKDFPYYNTMLAHFETYNDHPLLDSVNFSRERWKEYLSFRTDAVAFKFDENDTLKRTNNFHSFEINTFDNHLALVEDFAKTSNFRAFFKTHKAYREQLTKNYSKIYMMDEMRTFLSSEFGDLFAEKKYKVMLSPFVYAQNLHRDIDSLTTADFPSLGKSIISGKNELSKREQATEIHTLFTEMNHGYVNPATTKMNALVSANFNERIWNNESGYENNNNAVFNEYMTWALYDLFNKKHFPELANEINTYWHFQNESRGFTYSNYFAQKLATLYSNKKTDETIEDLYPELLEWTKTVEKNLTKPMVVFPKDSIAISFSKQTNIKLSFSEPLKKVDKFTLILQDASRARDTLTIDTNQNLTWNKQGTELSFTLDRAAKKDSHLIINWWGCKNVLQSPKGILLKTSFFQLQNN